MSQLNDLMNLNLSDTMEKVIAEYVWIGGSGMDHRSKARTLPGLVESPQELPKWKYDGSSTGQAPGEDSEVILYPQAIFKDPFRRGNNILVMCDTYTPAGDPLPTNKRFNAAKIFSHPDVIAEEPWYGMKQQFILLRKAVGWPIRWPIGGYPAPDQEPYYCGIVAEEALQRDIVESHYKACLYAGININQIGHSLGISAGDELWIARYILERITERAGVVLSFDPKPIQGDWNTAGVHIEYSAKSMRNGGVPEVIKAIKKLGSRREEHIAAWGVANYGASIQVCRETNKAGVFYLRDNRPASNMDPYVVTSMIAETTILWQP